MSIEDDKLSKTHDKSEIKNPNESLEAKKDKSFLITAKISKHFKKYLGNKKAESWLIEKIRKGAKQ